jgi:uncharacterized repeat protein (TIGR01451 family)
MATYKWDPSLGMYILSDDQSFTVVTNQSDYIPGQTVQIAATFDPGSTVQLMVAHDIGAGADGIWGTADDVLSYDLAGTGLPWTVTADANGLINASWFVNQDALGQSFELIATELGANGAASGPMVTKFFTDGQPNLSANQWIDIGHGGTPVPIWTNGDLNPSNSDYAEGDSVAFRTVFSGLQASHTYTITVEFESLKGGDHAYDFLDAWNSPTLGKDPTLAQLLDGTGLTVAGTGFGAFSIWGGTINGVSAPVDHLSNNNLNQLTDVTVTFTTDGTLDPNNEALLAWGGHLAVTGTNYPGAGLISGGPFHMFVVDSAKEFSGGGQLSIHDIGGTPGPGPGTTPAIDVEKFVSFDSGANWYYHDDGTETESSALLAAEYDVATGSTLTAANFIAYNTSVPTLLSGTNPEYLFLVTNVGTAELTGVTLTDSPFSIGGSGAIGSLAVGASAAVTFTGQTWATGSNSDTATVNGQSADDPTLTGHVMDTDSVAYSGVTAGIEVDKLVSVDGGTNWWFTADDANDTIANIASITGIAAANLHIGSPTLLGGFSSPQYEFVVTNTGDVDLNSVTLSDSLNNLGLAGTIGTLAAGASTTVTATGTWAHGDQPDTATVGGSFTDSGGHTVTPGDTDPADYKGVTASIEVDKLVSVDGGTNWWFTADDTNDTVANIASITGIAAAHLHIGSPTLLGGFSSPQYEFVVTNTGDVDLNSVTLSDSLNNLGLAGTIGTLAAGASTTVTATGTWAHGDQPDTATVGGSFTDSGGHTVTPGDTDPADYKGVTASINIEKLVSVDGGTNWWFTADDAFDTVANLSSLTGILAANLHIGTPTTLAGATVKYEVVVSNTGDVTDNSLVVTDLPVLPTSFTLPSSSLAAGAHEVSNVVTATAVALTQTDTATVNGASAADNAGNTAPVTDHDSASYTGLALGNSGLTQGFWSTHSAAWASNAADTTWGNLWHQPGGLWGDDYSAANVVIAAAKKGFTGNDNIIWGLPNHGDSGPSGAAGVLLGDADGDGTNLWYNGTSHVAGVENTQFMSLSAAQTALAASSTGNSQTIMLNQLIAAQLNIYNGDHDPGSYNLNTAPGHDLVGEAVQWLKGSLLHEPLDGAGNTVKFLTSDVAWTSKFFDTGISVSGHGEIMASGQDIKNVLQAFNQGNIVTAANDSLIGWTTDGGVHLLGVHANTPDNFWLVAYENHVITG